MDNYPDTEGLALIHEKHPEKMLSYLEYAKAHKASKEAIKELKAR